MDRKFIVWLNPFSFVGILKDPNKHSKVYIVIALKIVVRTFNSSFLSHIELLHLLSLNPSDQKLKRMWRPTDPNLDAMCIPNTYSINLRFLYCERNIWLQSLFNFGCQRLDSRLNQLLRWWCDDKSVQLQLHRGPNKHHTLNYNFSFFIDILQSGESTWLDKVETSRSQASF